MPIPDVGLRTPAGFWLRFCAAFLDSIITGVAGSIVGAIFGFIAGSAGMAMGWIEAGGYLIGTVLGWFYAAFMESSPLQASVGKMAVGIKVTDMQGQRISFARATGRHFAKWISTIILFIGYFMMLFTDKKQTLHDMISGCLVSRR